MKLYRAVSEHGTSPWTTSKKKALRDFEDEQDAVIHSDFGVEECDSVELESIEIPDDITDALEDDPKIEKKLQVVVDNEKHKTDGNPRESGYDFDWWATWAEVEI